MSSKNVTVPAKQEGGVPTGVSVKAGDLFTVTASGQARFNADNMTYPDGQRYYQGGPTGARFNEECVVPAAPAGTLIARIGSAPWLVVGSILTWEARSDGEVTLAYNDVPGLYGDNSGEYQATIDVHAQVTDATMAGTGARRA